MTKGPWKYQKAEGHHHVLMGEESLDINKESDARAIALVPEMIEFLKEISGGIPEEDVIVGIPYRAIRHSVLAKNIFKKLEKKK